MLLKLRIPVMVGVPYYFVDPTAPPGTAPKWVRLLSFKIENGRFEYDMESSEKHRIVGTLRSCERLELFEEGWVTPAIPVILHDKKKDGLAPDFMFAVPSQFKIEHRSR